MADHRFEFQENFHPKSLNCNFKAPTWEQRELWDRFARWCKDHGLDVCRVALNQAEAFMQAVEGSATNAATPKPIVTAKGQVIVIQQQNSFVYPVEKPRRLPIVMSCSKSGFQRTLSSIAAEAYVMEKARDLTRSFSVNDFRELSPNSFRKIVMRLKKKGKIVPLPQRTNPRFYATAERLRDYRR